MIAVLFSGGVDSMLLAHKAHRGEQLGALIFVNYGQPAAIEEHKASKQWAIDHGYDLHVIKIDIAGTNERMNTGTGSDGLRELPGRNLIMLSQAANIAIQRGCDRLWYGANAADRDYADCTPQFVRSVNQCFKASGLSIMVDAPLVRMDKRQIVRDARGVGMDIARAWSCYQSDDGEPCGMCNSCIERLNAVDGGR